MTSLDFCNIGEAEKIRVLQVLDTGYVSTASPLVSEFEQKAAAMLGVPDAIATNCGTSALHVALMVSGIGQGDEVILPVTTFIATANAISYTGATPVFVDVHPVTWCIDPGEVRKAITERTKAIMVVHLYGVPADMRNIMRLAREYGLTVIEDAAQAFGALAGPMPTGTIGAFGCFSFNGNKALTSGGGGLLVGSDLREARVLAGVGKDESGEFVRIGYNYRMTGLCAALGLAQLDRAYDLLHRKRHMHEIYSTELPKSLTLQQTHFDTCPSWWYTAALFPTDAGGIQERLAARGIPTRRVFKPLTEYPMYRNGNSYPVAERLYRHGICLPSSTRNDDRETRAACQAIRQML